MKVAIAILLVVGLLMGAWKVYWYYDQVKTEEAQQATATQVTEQSLQGMPGELESSFAEAKAKGTKAVGEWLKANRKKVKDPRLAWIELDYVILVSREDIAEARRVFAEVKARLPASSPVYPRVKQLEQTYE